VALAQEHIEFFRAAVHARIAEPPGTRGRLTCAYVRTWMTPIRGEEQRERYALLTQLLVVPAVHELVRADDERWRVDLAADAVPCATRNLVIAAADGVGGPPLWSSPLSDAERDRLGADLIAMVDRAVAG
jgi:hypothetical protein